MYFSKNNDIKLSEIYSKLKDLKSYEDKNYLCKKGDEKQGIKEYVVDFYPIKII